jgi:HEAT repeat protein
MRFTPLSAVALSLFFAGTPAASGQGGAKTTSQGGAKMTSEASRDQAIGGKKFDDWLHDLKDPDPSVVENAIRTVPLYGKLAREAAPILINKVVKTDLVYLDISIKSNIAIFLGTVGVNDGDQDDAVRALRALLNDSESYVRYQAAIALGRYGPDAKAAIPYLLSKLGDSKNWEVRRACAQALGTVALPRKAGTAVDNHVLRGLLARVSQTNEKCAQVRLEAIHSLVLLGPPAASSPASQSTEQVLKQSIEQSLRLAADRDRDLTVRIWAHVALMRMGKVDEKRLATLGKLLDHKLLGVRCQAARAIGSIGPDASSQIGSLKVALQDKEPTMVGWAIWALGQMGTAAMSSVPAIEAVAKKSDNPGLKQFAEEAIKAIQAQKPKK